MNPPRRHRRTSSAPTPWWANAVAVVLVGCAVVAIVSLTVLLARAAF